MKRALVILAACGGTSAKPTGPVNVHPGSGDPEKPAVEDCQSRTEGWHPGNKDRFSFEDPKTHKFGFKDGKGAVVIPAIFPHVYEFSPMGVAAVVDGESPFLFVDPSGKVLARAYAYDNGPDYFQEGFARIVDDNKRVGFMTDRGVIAIAPSYTGASGFCHGKAEVELDEDTFFIDKQGNKTTAPVPDPTP